MIPDLVFTVEDDWRSGSWWPVVACGAREIPARTLVARESAWMVGMRFSGLIWDEQRKIYLMA
jgi:hypothetical protein